MKEPKIVKSISLVRKGFERVGRELDKARGDQVAISYADALMSGLAVFQLKMPSLLQYDYRRGDVRMEGLFGIKRAPSDTRLREMLDEVNPDLLRPVFKEQVEYLRRNRHLEEFKSLDGYYPLSVDATQHFHSKSVHCEHCLEKHHRNGTVSYSHQMLAGSIVNPYLKEVVPVCPEPIRKQDGSTKNDCEQNAFFRFFRKFRVDHPKLPCIFLLDSLYSKGPIVELLNAHSCSHYIIGAKPGDHKYLFEWVSCHRFHELSVVQSNGDIHHYQYINNAPLNLSRDDLRVNFLNVEVQRANGKKNTVFSFVTDIKISHDNINELTSVGRSRWKIENETFNTLKNQGYNFEHNYGHGYRHLSTVLAMLMMLAFAIDQFQQLSCGLFNKALQNAGARYILWQNIRSIFNVFKNLATWQQLFAALVHGHFPASQTVPLDTS